MLHPCTKEKKDKLKKVQQVMHNQSVTSAKLKGSVYERKPSQ